MVFQMVLISPEQSRAARALLNWTTTDMQAHSGLGINTIQRFERGQTNLSVDTLGKLVNTYNAAGIEFPDPDTVRRVRREEVKAAA